MEFFMLAIAAIGLISTAVAGVGFYRKQLTINSVVTSLDRSSVDMIFHGNDLIDADDIIWQMFPNPQNTPTWDDMRTALKPLLPDLPKALTKYDQPPDDTSLGISISNHGANIRVAIQPKVGVEGDWFAMEQSNAFSAPMQSAVMLAPFLMWCLEKDSIFVWGNDTFSLYAKAYGGPSAFADHLSKDVSDANSPRTKRIKLMSPDLRGHQDRWLDITIKETESGRICFAIGVDAVVRAEGAQQNFVQTLSKTFANLTTGLAIFDRDRRLVLFNPALVDLSGVPIDFLSARPAMFEFFDKLRECRIMPEPKSYDDWRERMAKLVAAASDDRFRETWTLASGQTFDITGQPYPDGAIAFLVNDITAEVSLTRGYRAELNTLQSVIDTMDDAVAVFDSQGILTVCNTAYATSWEVDPEACIPETTIVEATQSWKSAFHPSPVWPELRDFVLRSSERASWDTELRGTDGREVICRVDPICHGATLIRFSHPTKTRNGAPETDGLQIVSA